MNDLYGQLLSDFQTPYRTTNHNSDLEVMQQIVLAGLHRGGFFGKAAFYGGTCLRIFHHLDRFSEDLDFSLLKGDPSFDLSEYFPEIEQEFSLLGRKVSFSKEKSDSGKIKSAFLKDNTEIYNISFQTERSLKIKIEVDTMPPLKFETEQKLLLKPYSFMTRCFTLPGLYAGKMHAMVFRNWKNRVKGRDWYDFQWFVMNGTPLDFIHLQERIKEFNGLELNKEDFMRLLRERIENCDIGLVKKDVLPFISDPQTLDIWSKEYFLDLTERITFKE